MDKYEVRRNALEALVKKLGRGGIAKVAQEIRKEPSYVSRMLYPPGKSGRKRIGEDSAEILDSKFPGWLRAPAQGPQEACAPVVPYGPVGASNVTKISPQRDPIIDEITSLAEQMNARGLAQLLERAIILASQHPRRTLAKPA